VAEPGDLVQVDTVEVRPMPGVMIKQSTARDVVSRWDVVEAHSRATAGTASRFLGCLLERMPFPVKAIQVDGGERVPGGVRAGLSGVGYPATRVATPLPEAQRSCGAGAANAQGRVLRLLRQCLGPSEPRQGAAQVGAGLQHDPSTPIPWQETAGAVSSRELPQDGPGSVTVSHVLNEYNNLTRREQPARMTVRPWRSKMSTGGPRRKSPA